jgi:DNA-binding NarL/FixJ family response regulator
VSPRGTVRAHRPVASETALAARGLSNAEIGRQLYISETTVKTHITHILQKLQLRDRVQAVVLADQTGLVDPS